MPQKYYEAERCESDTERAVNYTNMTAMLRLLPVHVKSNKAEMTSDENSKYPLKKNILNKITALSCLTC